MKIITDTAANLLPERAAELGIEVVPFHIHLMGETYRDGIDITPERLYKIYEENPHEFSKTSQPSVGDFVSLYEKFEDEEILSIHLSSGLSGTFSSASSAAKLISPERITVVDSKMVGPGLGWMVEVAAHGAKSGWSKERILEAVNQIRENTLTMVGFTDLRHLIHSGRVSHLKGIIAAILKIKPIIGMNDVDGRYVDLGKEMTVSRVSKKMASIVEQKFGAQKVRLQLMHGDNPAGVKLLRKAMTNLVDVVEEKLVAVTIVLGAHAGPTVFGLAAIPDGLLNSYLQ